MDTETKDKLIKIESGICELYKITHTIKDNLLALTLTLVEIETKLPQNTEGRKRP